MHYLSFKVKIPQLRAEVRRKDEEFDMLEKYLAKAYPNVISPPISSFKGSKVKALRYVAKRAVILQRFLKNCLRTPLLRGDQYLMSFLSDTQDKWKKVKKNMNK